MPAAAQSADDAPASERPAVASPSTINTVQVEIDGGVPMYHIARLGEPVVEPSPLGFALEDAPDLDGPFAITAVDTSSFDNTWEQVWGEKQFIRNHYNELRITLTEQEAPGRDLVVTFRVYDDGVGFRYEFPEQEDLEQFRIADELTEFRMTGDHESWYIDAYQWNRFEYYFENTPLSEADTVHTPLT
ncbi:MAG: glycoside hydrolase family 97 N-terminal domain-containing protein, partial [Longimonas sp.]|uniref:glycoside hydrolase family 97 N-terminal domain-containing protein n=1 Tax=Longimonas sp. TaxID=2039626 RepID=UPI003975B27B